MEDLVDLLSAMMQDFKGLEKRVLESSRDEILEQRVLLSEAGRQFRNYQRLHEAKLAFTLSGSEQWQIKAKIETNKQLADKILSFLGETYEGAASEERAGITIEEERNEDGDEEFN